MFRPRVLLAGLLLLLIVVLIVQNTEVVSVRLLFWELRMSRVILILLSTGTGFLCGYLVAKLGGSRAPAG